jgi:lysophospholipase L1-like esterase
MNTTTKKAANSIVGKLTAGILATAAVAGGCLPPAAAAFQAGGDAVLVIGDSLEEGSGPYLRAALPGLTLDVDAERGRTSGQGTRVLAERLEPQHRVVVFPLGTNDSPADPGGLAASLAMLQQLAGDRCLVVATLARPPLRGVSVAALNRAVEGFAAQTGALVADWRSVVQAIPELLTRDRVHATGEGYGVRAGLLAEAIQGCLLGGGASAGVGGIPAPRDPNARPPRRREAAAGPALLPLPVEPAVGAVSRCLAPVGAALRAARTAATKEGPEPVLGL